jgi:hypothetical protein
VLIGWGKDIDLLFGERCEVALMHFIELALSKQGLHALLAQVMWHLAVCLESHLGKVAQGGVQSSIEFSWVDGITELRGSGMQLKLAQYVVCSRKLFDTSSMFCFACDKGIVSRLPLRKAYLTNPSGFAAVCAPVVVMCSNSATTVGIGCDCR